MLTPVHSGFVFLGKPQVPIFLGWLDPSASRSEKNQNQGLSDVHVSSLTATPLQLLQEMMQNLFLAL